MVNNRFGRKGGKDSAEITWIIESKEEWIWSNEFKALQQCMGL
jgi:hypothetical protein